MPASLRMGLALTLTLAIGVAAFGIAPESTLDAPPLEIVQRELPAPEFAEEQEVPATFWREERIQRGDTIGSVLARLGIVDAGALEFVRRDAVARALYQLRPGRAVRAEVADDGSLQALRYLVTPADELTIERGDSGFGARVAAASTDARLSMASAVIHSSLYGAADAAGLPEAVTQQIAEMFSGDIDFYHDLRRGDRFSVVFEVLHVDGEPVRSGRVVAAEFVNRGQVLRAFWWSSPDGGGGYYTEDGKSLRKAFLRSPMEFSRITSGFSLARLHPILKSWRAHKGVDYGAPTGTPVRVTGDGKVTFAGTQGGYGNVVIVQHHGAYSTLYAHLSRFAAATKVGARVGQGEVIGHVGQTGWATGPHLHYEFRVDRQQKDPLRMALPQAPPMAAAQRPVFLVGTAEYVARIELLRGLPVASAN